MSNPRHEDLKGKTFPLPDTEANTAKGIQGRIAYVADSEGDELIVWVGIEKHKIRIEDLMKNDEGTK